MENLIIASIISSLGVLISATVSIIICKLENKTKLFETHSEFIRQLYSKRIDVYLIIFNLISDYIKNIKRKGILYNELLVFYENYSKLDSKSSLLFSYTSFYSERLMKKVEEVLNYYKKNQSFPDNCITDLLIELGYVETTMKLELGVYVYKDPVTISKTYQFPERKKKMINDIIKNYKEGILYNKN